MQVLWRSLPMDLTSDDSSSSIVWPNNHKMTRDNRRRRKLFLGSSRASHSSGIHSTYTWAFDLNSNPVPTRGIQQRIPGKLENANSLRPSSKFSQSFFIGPIWWSLEVPKGPRNILPGVSAMFPGVLAARFREFPQGVSRVFRNEFPGIPTPFLASPQCFWSSRNEFPEPP